MKKEYHIVHRLVKGGRHKRDRDISPRVIKPQAILGDRGREGGSKIQFLRRRRLWMFPNNNNNNLLLYSKVHITDLVKESTPSVRQANLKFFHWTSFFYFLFDDDADVAPIRCQK